MITDHSIANVLHPKKFTCEEELFPKIKLFSSVFNDFVSKKLHERGHPWDSSNNYFNNDRNSIDGVGTTTQPHPHTLMLEKTVSVEDIVGFGNGMKDLIFLLYFLRLSMFRGMEGFSVCLF